MGKKRIVHDQSEPSLPNLFGTKTPDGFGDLLSVSSLSVWSLGLFDWLLNFTNFYVKSLILVDWI